MALVTVLILAATALSLAACTSTTRAAGPAADATHETRVERPGKTSERRVEIRVRPGGGEAAGDEGTEARRHGGTEGPRDGGSEARRHGGTEAPRHEGTGEGDGSAAGRGGAGVSGAPASSAAVSQAPRDRGTEAPRVQVVAGQGVASARAAVVMAAVGAGQSTGGQAASGTADDSLDAVLRAAAELAESRGVVVEIVVDEYEHEPLTADTTSSTIAESPATLDTRSGEAALGFTTKLRRFALPWGGEAAGGGFGFEAELLGGQGANALHLVGAAVMCLAVIPLLRTPRRWGSAAVFAGVGLAIVMTGTLVDRYPWVTLLAAMLLLGLLAYGAYEAWRRGRLTRSLDVITPVVEHAPNGDTLKTQIGQRAGRLLAAVKAETTASKARAGT